MSQTALWDWNSGFGCMVDPTELTCLSLMHFEHRSITFLRFGCYGGVNKRQRPSFSTSWNKNTKAWLFLDKSVLVKKKLVIKKTLILWLRWAPVTWFVPELTLPTFTWLFVGAWVTPPLYCAHLELCHKSILTSVHFLFKRGVFRQDHSTFSSFLFLCKATPIEIHYCNELAIGSQQSK